MKLSICQIDTTFFLTERNLRWMIQSIDSFKKNVSDEDLEKAQIGASRAISYYARSNYDPKGTNMDFIFNKNAIFEKKNGNANAYASACRSYGVLYDDDAEGVKDVGEIGEIANLYKRNIIQFQEFCFIFLAKQWVLVDDKCSRNLLSIIYELIAKEGSTFLNNLGNWTAQNSKIIQCQFFEAVAKRPFDEKIDKISFSRFDNLRNCLVLSGILEDKGQNKTHDLNLSEQGELILEDFYNHERRLTKYVSSRDSKDFHKYMCTVENGAFDVISSDNSYIYEPSYPNIVKYSKKIDSEAISPKIPELLPFQQIRYGAPGTGKSFEIDKITKKYSNTIRTTFHPDTDYVSFVGAYKPATSERNCYGLDANGNTKYLIDLSTNDPLKEIQVEYKFIKQAFVKAYIKAWTLFKETYKNDTILEPQFLIIEEINRGNCAQIFGDLFQLLDRKNGFSEYPIIADEDIRKCLLADSKDDDLSFGKYGLQLSLRQRAAINRVYDEPDKPSRGIADKICNGEILALPCNFYILATMNTSDQSLFPMDSAFKRRWSWKYEVINYKDASQFKIKLGSDGNEKEYPWDEFLLRINKKIALDLHSGAKQMGNRFVKTDEYIITEEDFINKVIFYLFTDAYKDDDSFGMYFFDKDENSEGVWLFENIFDYGNNPSYLCQNFIEHLIRDFSINEYLQAKATIVK